MRRFGDVMEFAKLIGLYRLHLIIPWLRADLILFLRLL